MVELVVLAGLVIVAVIVLSFVLKVAGIVIAIATWMCAGYLAGQLIRGRSFGPIGDTALGLVGGIVGSLVLRLFNLGGVTNIIVVGNIIAGVVGAVVLIYAVRFFHNKDFAK